MTLYAEVVLPLPLSESFSYLIPENWQEQVKIGTRVLVPFRSRVLTGFVTSLRKRRIQKDIKLKEIQEVLDEKPLFSANFLSFTSKLSDYYFTSWGELLQASLPPAYVLKSKTVIHLSAEGEEALKKEKLSKEGKKKVEACFRSPKAAGNRFWFEREIEENCRRNHPKRIPKSLFAVSSFWP